MHGDMHQNRHGRMLVPHFVPTATIFHLYSCPFCTPKPTLLPFLLLLTLSKSYYEVKHFSVTFCCLLVES